MRMLKITKEQAEEFYSQERGKPHFAKIVQFLSSDAITVLEVVGEQPVQKLQALMGPDHPNEWGSAPNTIRGQFGTDDIRNSVYGSHDLEQAEIDLDFFFGPNSKRLAQTAVFDNCTLCVIKPHVLAARQAGKVIDDILARGFEVSAAQLFKEDRSNIEEFFEVYKGVVPEYEDMVTQLLSGPFIALEIRAEDAVSSFREFTGPVDPEISRTLRPHTLRALYGHDKIRNGLHCTDLPEDGTLEVEYFFKLLQR
jgi:nucleoside-diphosphate kinase